MIGNGDILGGMYRIIGEIDQGGTGIIYLAEHLRLQKRVVVKKIKDHFVGHVNGRAEVDILKRLHHSYLPQMYDFLVIDGSIYTVMEYIEGRNLQEYLNQGTQFSEATVHRWLVQLCEVLMYLHSQTPPILHSDIKPANIMITTSGNVCLIDFNISLDGENSKDIMGVSQWFAAPEQFSKAQNVIRGVEDHIVLDERMDIYSLAATFYHVMTGGFPSPQKEVPDIRLMDIPYSDGLKSIISKAMRRRRSMRYASAAQMYQALKAVGRMDPLYRRYSKLQIAVGFSYLLCVIVSTLFLYYGNWQNQVEHWNADYRKLYVTVENREEEAVVTKATQMLNDFRYDSYFDRHEGTKAELCHILGDSYFRQELFRQAVEYYKEAWTQAPEESAYLKDYLIALVRDDRLSMAQTVLDSSDRRFLTSAELAYIQAEISWNKEDYEEALTQLEILAEESGDSPEVLRRLGYAYVDVAEMTEDSADRDAYLQKAWTCYQKLNSQARPTYEDRMNYARLERILGQYEASNETLNEILQNYEADYSASMWMCYNFLDIAREQGSYNSVRNELRYRYEECCRLYEKSGEDSEEMRQLTEAMEQIGE